MLAWGFRSPILEIITMVLTKILLQHSFYSLFIVHYLSDIQIETFERNSNHCYTQGMDLGQEDGKGLAQAIQQTSPVAAWRITKVKYKKVLKKEFWVKTSLSVILQCSDKWLLVSAGIVWKYCFRTENKQCCRNTLSSYLPN